MGSRAATTRRPPRRFPGRSACRGRRVSRAFIQASATKLRELQERDLSGEDVVALVLDGKTFAEATMVVALGITMTGDKRFLGFVETDTENEQVLTPFLRSLVERGLDVSQGLLVIVDGGKGLRAAVRHAFRHRALVQRCQWHKRENVVSYLAKREQPVWRQRLQRAYNRPEYDEALAALQSLQHELEDRNQSAAGSLAEGLDETLTLHRLGVYGVLGRFAPIGSRGFNPMFNSDGLLRDAGGVDGKSDGFLQLFRNGVLESVNSSRIIGLDQQDGVASTAFVEDLVRFLQDACRLLRKLQVGPPVLVLVSLLGVKNLPLFVGGGTRGAPVFDKNKILLPEVELVDLRADIQPILRLPLDVLWQAAGLKGCSHYDADGVWINR